MKNKKDHAFTALQLADVFSRIYFAMILVGLTLFFDKHFYTAMIPAKGRCYWAIAAIMIVFVLITFVVALVKKQEVLRFRQKLSALDFSLFGYAVAVLVSFIFSKDKGIAFFGTGGFYVGTFTLITTIAFYFFVSRNMTGSKNMWDMIIIFNCFIFIWVVCNSVSIDILAMHQKMKYENQILEYFGPLGQMDSVSGYLSLLLPIIIVFFLNEKKLHMWQCVAVITGLMALIGIRTDGIYIGITVCAIFLIPYAFQNMIRFQNVLWLGLFWGVGFTFYSVLSVLAPERIGTDMGVSGTLIKYWAGVIMIVVCGALLLWIEKKRIMVKERILQRIGMLGSIAVIIALVVFLGDGVVSLAQGDTGWGNGRGHIWLGALKMFKEYTPLQKMFGLGTTAIYQELTAYVGWQNIYVANAHNDFLEYLLSTGLFGFITYCATWIIPIVSYVKSRKSGKEWSVAKIAYFMALMGYLGQSIVGNPYSLIVPIMYLVFALFRNEDFQ